tara:strand:- start:269 stop:724 length:456 start_codon:yes stop_codon:yes gene_type:complete
MGPELLIIASAAASAVSTVSAGQAQKEASKFEAEQIREQAQMAKLQAANEGLKLLEEHERVRRANIAIAAGNGVLPIQSRSFQAIQKKGKDVFLRDQALIRLGGRSRVNQLQGTANQVAKAGQQAFTSSIINAGGTLIGGGMDLKELKDLD